LEAAAKTVDLPLRKLGALSQENVLADPLLGSSKELQKKAFVMQPDDSIEITELDDGHFVALQVLKRIEPNTMAYEDVVKRVFDDVRNDKAIKAAQDIADKALLAAKAGKNIDALVQQFAQGKFISKPVRSNGEGDDATWLSAVLEPAFRTPDAHWVDTVIATADGFAVVMVQEVQPADEALFAELEDTIRQDLVKAKGAVRFASWMASVRDRHDININNRVLNRF
jgi:peptidyl-prolyl cis-trans isomerase D